MCIVRPTTCAIEDLEAPGTRLRGPGDMLVSSFCQGSPRGAISSLGRSMSMKQRRKFREVGVLERQEVQSYITTSRSPKR